MALIPDVPAVLKSIRDESGDCYNRLHSIYEDSEFVTNIANQFPEYPVFGKYFVLARSWNLAPNQISSQPTNVAVLGTLMPQESGSNRVSRLL